VRQFLSVAPDLSIFLKAYGEAGVVHLVRILGREIKFGMTSLGVRTVDQLVPDLVRCGIIVMRVTLIFSSDRTSRLATLDPKALMSLRYLVFVPGVYIP